MPEGIKAEALMSNIMETFSDSVSKHKNVSFFQEEKSNSVTSQFNRLFGREKPVHHLLGGGKSADVLLWRNKKISAGVLTSATVVWVLFEWLNYNFLTLVSFALIVGMLAQFVWKNASGFLNRSPYKVPRLVLPEEVFVNIGKAIGSEVNHGLRFLQDVACGGNIKQFLVAVASLWAAAIIGSWCNFLTVLYIGKLIVLLRLKLGFIRIYKFLGIAFLRFRCCPHIAYPEDVITEILSRLPATSLLRFKCVCKSWSAIIRDHTFIAKHHRTISGMHNAEVVMISRRSNATNRRVISLLRNDGNDVVDHDLPTFLNDMFGHVRLIGPCNGIVCLYGYPDNIALWNPSIRCFAKLPASQVPRPPNSKVRGGDLGVGFEFKTRDIKVLQILFCVSVDSQIVCQVEIFSSILNSWKKFESIVPANIMYNNLCSMVFKNENFCWWAQDKNNVEVILSFNMNNEIFEMTNLPSGLEALGGQYRTTRAILPLKDSLALIVYRQLEVDKVFDIWVVNELGGGSETWSRLPSIGPISGMEKVLGFRNVSECILESSTGEMVLYNRFNRSVRNLGIYGKRSRLEVLVLTESLFAVN